jgi:hypothetical protein
MVDMVIARLLSCCVWKAEWLTIKRLNGCGEKKAFRCSIVTKSGHDYIIRIFLSSAYAINIPVISGKATSFMTS